MTLTGPDTHTQTHTHTHTQTHTRTHTHKHTHTQSRTYAHACMHAYSHAHTHTHTHIHTHTHTHTHAHRAIVGLVPPCFNCRGLFTFKIKKKKKNFLQQHSSNGISSMGNSLITFSLTFSSRTKMGLFFTVVAHNYHCYLFSRSTRTVR